MYKQGQLLVYEAKRCWGCQGEGTYKVRRRCPLYGRTVNRLPDRRCPHCGATAKHRHDYLDTGTTRVCDDCHGNLEQMQTRYDTIPVDILKGIPLKVFRSGRPPTWNESWLGVGCLWSTTDYGRSAQMDDEELVLHIKAHFERDTVQACHVVDKADCLPAYLGVFMSRGGYSVRAVHDPEAAPEYTRERVSTPQHTLDIYK